MKRYNLIKTIQLGVFAALAVLCLVLILINPTLYHLIATDSSFRLIAILLWIVLAMTFLFIGIDFNVLSSYKREISELDYAVHSDPLSGIANRYSCDAYIEQYMDKPLPGNIACVMFDITNIREINEKLGHVQGNNTIREFSSILRTTAVDICFVGRNGGNKFLAVFNEDNSEKVDFFLNRVAMKIALYNESHIKERIEYKYGKSFSVDDNVQSITDLIALANSRIYNQ